MAELKDKKPVSGKERIAMFRRREQERNLQVAVAAARLVVGGDTGDQSRALAAFLKKVLDRPDVPQDYQTVLNRAIDNLSARRRR